MSFEKRQPKPRPAGFRNDLSGLRKPIQGNSRPGGPPLRGPSKPPRGRGRAKGPAPQVKVPESPREKREMLKAAAWRMSKIVHCPPKAIISAPDPAALIKVPDPRASELARKIVRLKQSA